MSGESDDEVLKPRQRSETLKRHRDVVRDEDIVRRPPSPSQDVNSFDDFDFMCTEEEPLRGDAKSDVDTSTSDLLSIPDEAEASWTSPVTSIHSSHYLGDAKIEGRHKVSLTAKHGLRSRNQTLFKWL